MLQPYRKTLPLSLALLFLVVLVYWPGLHGGFVFDDYPNILTNARVHAEGLSWEAMRTAARAYEAGSYGRPLATISFALNYVVGGKDPWGFKLTNLAMHLANALLVFWLLRRLLSLPKVRGDSAWSAGATFTIALLWAIHPLQVSTVLYVVQRMEILSLTFVLLALIAYLHGRVAQRDGKRGWPWLAGSLVLAGMGLLSKETAVLFPLYALAMELTVLGFEARSPRTSRALKAAYAAGLVVALSIFALYVVPHHATAEAFASRDFSVGERLLTQLRVLPMYLGQMLLPLPASMPFYYDAYPVSTGWLRPATTLAGGLLLLGLAVAAWRVRRRLPLVSLGILWFFAAHALTSNVFALEIAFEHRNYFALLGVVLALADLVRRIPTPDGPALKIGAVAVVLVGFGLLAGLRSATWGNPLLLASDMVAKAPASARASNDLGEQYMNMSGMQAASPFYSMAQREFERGARLPGSSPLPEQALILMASASGQAAKPEWWQSLIDKVSTRPLGPQEQGAISGLMKQRYLGLPLDDAQLGKALAIMFRRGKMPPQAYVQYADYALTYLHDEALSERMFVEAIDHNRDDAEYAAHVFATLAADGRVRQANAVYARAKALGLMDKPGSSPVEPGPAATH